MCIIAVKPSHVPMPSDATISTMWRRNPDGAGFMFAHGGQVYIRKGFMHLDGFKKALRQIPANVPLVLHFRIATHGGISPGMCHPFPIVDSVKKLKSTTYQTKVGIAHNGIIPIKPRQELSDTAEYIISQLSPLSKALPEWFKNAHALKMVENGIQSRMAILSGSGDLITIGKGWVEEAGIKYSNTSYQSWDSYSFDSYEERLLMPLSSDDCYISMDGEMFEADEFAIDRSGNVYFMDYDSLAWEEAWLDCKAIRHNGTPMRFDESKAFFMDTLSYDYPI